MQKAVMYPLKRCSIVRKMLLQQCCILRKPNNVLYLVLIHALGSLFQINTDKCTDALLNHHSVYSIRNSYTFQPLMSHLQRLCLIHSTSVVNKMSNRLWSSKLFSAFFFSQQLYYSTHYTPRWILQLVIYFLRHAARVHQIYSLKMTFKGRIMLELSIMLIKWWFKNMWEHLSVFILCSTAVLGHRDPQSFANQLSCSEVKKVYNNNNNFCLT